MVLQSKFVSQFACKFCYKFDIECSKFEQEEICGADVCSTILIYLFIQKGIDLIEYKTAVTKTKQTQISLQIYK